MNEDLTKKDASYYEDLIYEVRKTTGLLPQRNEIIEARILKRIDATIKVVHVIGNGNYKYEYRMSTFQHDLLEVFREISKKHFEKNGCCQVRDIIVFKGWLRELVPNALEELEQKRQSLENTTNSGKRKRRKKSSR